MSVTLYFTVEDIDTQLLTYTKIRPYRSSGGFDGSFTVMTNEDLVAGQFNYSTVDATGDINKWYKYSLYNPTGPVESDLSAPFRPAGTTLLRIRQAALSKYGAGMVLTSGDSLTLSELVTEDYRFASSIRSAGHGKGSWLMPTSGDQAGLARMVVDSDPSAGSFDVDPGWPDIVANGEEVEWHWLARPDQWDDAVRRGLLRYFYLDRIPINGTTSQEYALSIFPWLHNKDYVKGLEVLWSGQTIPEPWGVMGRWWKVLEDIEGLTLRIDPAISADDSLRLLTIRQMPLLWRDVDSPPRVCSEELAAAYAYDEVLSLLTGSDEGSRIDRGELLARRARHQVTELGRLQARERKTLPFSMPQPAYPDSVPMPYSAR
jgi:hypothetical protein